MCGSQLHHSFFPPSLPPFFSFFLPFVFFCSLGSTSAQTDSSSTSEQNMGWVSGFISTIFLITTTLLRPLLQEPLHTVPETPVCLSLPLVLFSTLASELSFPVTSPHQMCSSLKGRGYRLLSTLYALGIRLDPFTFPYRSSAAPL